MKSGQSLPFTGKLLIVILLIGCFAGVSLTAQTAGTKANIGLAASAVKMVGDDIDKSMISPWLNACLGVQLSDKIGLELNGGFGWDRPFDSTRDWPIKYLKRYKPLHVRTLLYPIIANLKYTMKPEATFSPYAVLGAGVLYWDLIDVSGGDHFFLGPRFGKSVYGLKMNPLINIGFGLQQFIATGWAMDLSLRYQHLFDRDLDMTGFGDINTGNIEFRLGLSRYFGSSGDRDGDGIKDSKDGCPDQPEDLDGFQDEDGCPDLDNDGDGIPDYLDKSPNAAEDMDGYEDADGIPDYDNDNDGILDADDKSPNAPEDIDGYLDEDGTPDPDNDQDGILDVDDECPDEPETMNGYEDTDGCPDEAMQFMIPEEQSQVMEGVNFATGSADLTPTAKDILSNVLRMLRNETDIRVEVQGYTDSVGSRSANLLLSQRRADTVKDYLVSGGVSASRITAKGYGEMNPIATNETIEGRGMNRRIEFKRLD